MRPDRLQGVGGAVRPAELLDYTAQAERAGLRDRRGLRPLPALAPPRRALARRRCRGSAPPAQRTSRATLGTSVLTPTLRYEPAVIAQAFATLGCLAPGRVFLGVGTGEAMNETPVTGGAFPGRKERRMRLAEAIKLIRQLWSEERVDFEGEYYTTDRATIYDRPERARADLRRRLRPARGQARRAASATASSARAARTRRSTRSCSPTSPRAPSRRAATRTRSSA